MKAIRHIGIVCITYFIVTVLGDKQHSECSSVAEKFSELNIGHASLVPGNKLHDDDMEICYKGSTDKAHTSCCTRKMERKYHVTATKDFSDTVKQSSLTLRTMLQQRGKELQDELVQLVREAENRTASLMAAEFVQLPLEARRGPLESFFQDLTAYVRQREEDLHDSVATLFNELFPPVVQYLLTDSNRLDMDEEYRECLMEARQSLIPRPFGEAPNTLAVELSNGLGLAQLFIEAVGVGIEAVNTTAHLPWDLPCQRAVTRLTYCAHCSGDQDALTARPCAATCRAILRGCLGGVMQLGPAWDDYTEALGALTMATKDKLDIAGATARIPTHISEAVMHAMQSSHKYYAKMISRCGQPKSIQGDAPTPSSSSNTDSKQQPKQPLLLTPQQPLNAPTPRDQELAKEMLSIAGELTSSKGFYASLPDAVCSAERYSAPPNTPCWDGHKVSNSYADVTLEKAAVKIPSVKPQALVSLADKLAHIKKKLNKKASSFSASSSSLLADMEEQMQADGYRGYGSGAGHNSYDKPAGGRGGGGYYAVDDEDYTDASGYSSGYGSGGGGGKRKNKHPQYHTGRRGGNKNEPDDDMYIVDEDKNKQPYIRQTPNPDLHDISSRAAATVQHSSIAAASLCALLTTAATLYMCRHG